MTVSYGLGVRQSLHPVSLAFRDSSWYPAAGAWPWGTWSCDHPHTWDQKIKFRNKNCFCDILIAVPLLKATLPHYLRVNCDEFVIIFTLRVWCASVGYRYVKIFWSTLILIKKKNVLVWSVKSREMLAVTCCYCNKGKCLDEMIA